MRIIGKKRCKAKEYETDNPLSDPHEREKRLKEHLGLMKEAKDGVEMYLSASIFPYVAAAFNEITKQSISDMPGEVWQSRVNSLSWISNFYLILGTSFLVSAVYYAIQYYRLKNKTF